MKILIAVLCLAGLLQAGKAADWYYPDRENASATEPLWGGVCDSGKRQSPIALNSNTAFKGYFDDFDFDNYDDEFKNAVLINTGHSIQINSPDKKKFRVKGGGLNGKYIFEQMHWHWWSEHTINGRRYPLEVHLVHRNEDYADIQEALKHRGGVAVLGVLFHVSDRPNKHLSKILDNMAAIGNQPGQSVDFRGVKPEHFLPDDVEQYFRYEGSLTTPGCDEGVIWTVFEDTIPVEMAQVEKFAQMKDSHGYNLKYNYRSNQPEFNRAVTYVVDKRREAKNSASIITTSFILILTLGLAKLLIV